MSQYFLGVDGGQSSTRAVVGDENGRVLGIGQGGPSNYAGAPEGSDRFVAALRSCLRAACRQAGLNAGTLRFAGACLGFSGGPADKEPIVRQILASERTLVTDDAAVALSGATAGKPGIVVIAGTGSIAFGRNAAGRTARAGGWGYLFGDEGGAFWIARAALRTALRWEEGWGEPTSLRGRLLGATGARNMNDLLHRCYTPEFERPRVARWALLVNEAAESSDLAALEILGAAAQELALLAKVVHSQLFADGEKPVMSYVGGVFGSRILRARFGGRMLSEMGLPVTAPVYDPGVGALIEAYRIAGLERHGIEPLVQADPGMIQH
jgi:N-acetylglucosamine kinase-like BadF-type ATPase